MEVVGEAALQIKVQGVVSRIAFRKLCANVAEGRDHAGGAQRVIGSKQRIKCCRRKSSQCLHKELVWRIGAEKVCRNWGHYALAGSVPTENAWNNNGEAQRASRAWRTVAGGQREELRRSRIRWRDAKETTEVFNQQIIAHQINVAWMRQVMRANKDVIR